MLLRVSLLFAFLAAPPASLLASGRLGIRAVDADSNKPLAARMLLKNAQGKVIKPPKLKGAVQCGDWIVLDGGRVAG